jgi:hypothetical protein
VTILTTLPSPNHPTVYSKVLPPTYLGASVSYYGIIAPGVDYQLPTIASYNDPALRAKWKTALRLPGPAPEVIAAGESNEIALSLFSTQTSDLNGFSDITMLKLKICVLIRPQRLRSHSYSRTRLERSPSTVMFTSSGFHAVTATSP